MPESTRNTYVRQLRSYDIRHVAKAISQMITEPREPFQSAFPDLGTIIARVIAVRDSRSTRGRLQSCGQCFDGFRIFNCDDDTPHHRIRDNGRDTYAKECNCLQEWRGGADRKTVAAGA